MVEVTERSGEIAAWLAQFRDRLASGEGADLVERLAGGVLADVPEVARDHRLSEEVRASFDASVAMLIDLLPEGELDDAAIASTALLNLGRELARREVDVAVLLRTFAVARRVFWSYVMGSALEAPLAPAFREDLLTYLWDSMSRTLESLGDQIVAAYFTESRRLAQDDLIRRNETARRLLDGDDLDDHTASRLLAHSLIAHQTVAVLHRREGTHRPDAGQELETYARALAQALSAPAPLSLPAGPGRLLCWFATTRAPDAAELRTLAALPRPAGVVVGLSSGARGAGGFRAAHDEAVRAEQLVLGRADAAFVVFRDVEVACCLNADPDAAAAFAARTLGPLAGDGATVQRLRETLLAYLRGGSAAKAAELLTVHRNTVLYRLQQVEEALGRPVDGARFELEAALTLVEATGRSPQ